MEGFDSQSEKSHDLQCPPPPYTWLKQKRLQLAEAEASG